MNNFLKPALSHSGSQTTVSPSSDLTLPENASPEKSQSILSRVAKRFWALTEESAKSQTKPFEGIL